MLNVYVFYARGCKNTLAVTPTLHCWSKKKRKTQREEWDFQCSWVSLYHGTHIWHWHGPAAQSISCQWHNPAATNEGCCAVVTVSSNSLSGLETQLCPVPATWNHAWLRKLPARRLAPTKTSMLPEFMTLYTLSAYSNLPHTAAQEVLGCLCWAHQGRNASPTPQ